MINTKKTCYLFLDYDGTVFLHGAIPPEHKAAMEAVQRLGHQVILNTGRSRGGLDFSLAHNQGISWDGMIFGATDMIWGGVRYHEHTLTQDEVFSIVNTCLDRGCWFALEGENRTKRYPICEPLNLPMTESDRATVLEDVFLFCANNPITKMSVGEAIEECDLPSGGNIRFLKQPRYTELLPNGRDKGIAFLEFCKLYGIPQEQCVCFGDSLNDLAIFCECPTSVCMKNAPNELKARATYVAKTELGVAEGIKWLFGNDLGLTNPRK